MNSQAELIYIFGAEKVKTSLEAFPILLLKLQENISPIKLQSILEEQMVQFIEEFEKEENCAELLGISIEEYQRKSKEDECETLKKCLHLIIPKMTDLFYPEFEGVLTIEETKTFVESIFIVGVM